MLNKFSGDDLAHFSGALPRRPGQPLPENGGRSGKSEPFYITCDLLELVIVRADALDELILDLLPSVSLLGQAAQLLSLAVGCLVDIAPVIEHAGDLDEQTI